MRRDPTLNLLVLSRRLLQEGESYLNMMLHSPSLVQGLTPFCRTSAHVDRLHDWRPKVHFHDTAKSRW